MSEAVSAGKAEKVVILSVGEVKMFLEEGEKLLENGEVVQACEPIYKAAEDAVKILAKEHTWELKHVKKLVKRYIMDKLMLQQATFSFKFTAENAEFAEKIRCQVLVVAALKPKT